MFTNGGVSKAQAEVRKLREARVQFEEKEIAAREELAGIVKRLPSLALQTMLDPPDEPIADITKQRRERIAVLNEELENLAITRPSLLKLLEKTLVSVNVAKADQFRKEAGKLQKQRDTHKAESDRLRSLLEAHEDAPFVPQPVLIAFQGRTLGGQDSKVGGDYSAPRLTKTDILSQEIERLLAEASRLENKPVNVGGAIEMAMLAEVVQAVEQMDDTIAPTRRMIEGWYPKALADAEGEWEKFASNFPGEPLERDHAIILLWSKDGVIAEGSQVVFRQKMVWKKAIGYMANAFH